MSQRDRDVEVGFGVEEGALLAGQMVVIACLLVVEMGFRPWLGVGSWLILALLSARLAVGMLERAWVARASRSWDEAAVERYARSSVLGQLGFAALLAIVAPSDHSHFVALFILPIVSAAFRLSGRWLAGVTVAVVGVGLGEVWLEGLRGETRVALEAYEYSSVALGYVFVGFATALLSRGMRSRQARLEASLARLAEEERLAAVGRLSAALAHELRNPLAMLKASASALAGMAAEDPERGGMEAVLEAESARLERLTSDFLRYARPRSLAREGCDVAVALAYIASLAKARAEAAGVRIEVDAAPQLVVSADSEELHRALLNLVDNAIAAAPPGSVVALRASLGVDLRLRFENAGPAIAEEDVPRLFEPFFSRRPGGTGLGLAIARRIVEAHGGRLELRENRDGGVAFELTLPREG